MQQNVIRLTSNANYGRQHRKKRAVFYALYKDVGVPKAGFCSTGNLTLALT
jgi:hypothetical protein